MKMGETMQIDLRIWATVANDVMWATIDLLPTDRVFWATVAIALATVAAALVTVALVRATHKQIREVRKSAGAEVYFQVREKFYNTDLMRSLRRRAASELKTREELSPDQREKHSCPAFDELGNFFDFIGTLVLQNALNKEMVASSFRRRALAFWAKAWELGVIQRVTKIHKTRWDNFEELTRIIQKVYVERYGREPSIWAKFYRATMEHLTAKDRLTAKAIRKREADERKAIRKRKGALGEDEIRDILERENELPTLKDELPKSDTPLNAN